MSELVERVARAIAKRIAIREHGEHYQGYESGHLSAATDYACEAIAAMREPTREMLIASDREAEDKYLARGRAYSAWVNMIDEALK